MQLADGGVHLDDAELETDAVVVAVGGETNGAGAIGTVDLILAVVAVIAVPSAFVIDKQAVGAWDIVPSLQPEAFAVGGVEGVGGVVGLEIVVASASGIHYRVAATGLQRNGVVIAVGHDEGVGRAGGDKGVTEGSDTGRGDVAFDGVDVLCARGETCQHEAGGSDSACGPVALVVGIADGPLGRLRGVAPLEGSRGGGEVGDCGGDDAVVLPHNAVVELVVVGKCESCIAKGEVYSVRFAVAVVAP